MKSLQTLLPVTCLMLNWGCLVMLDTLGTVALCTSLIFLDLEALFKGVTSYAVACQQKGVGNGSTHFQGSVVEVGKVSVGVFTAAS